MRGLKGFSHVWLLFLFDQNINAGWKPTVRPPRLGGNERIGVFASRATFRPNAIGMSAVEVIDVVSERDQTYIELGGVDLVDGTPIIDIKPYIPYSDAIPEAIGGYADSEPDTCDVLIHRGIPAIDNHPQRSVIEPVIKQVLEQDPRPAYKKGKSDSKIYSVRLFDLDIKFKADEKKIEVIGASLVS